MAPVPVADLTIDTLVPARDLTTDREDWLVQGLIAELPSLRMAELFRVRRDMFREADFLTVGTDPTTATPVAALSSRWVALPSGGAFLHVLTQFVGERHRQSHAFRRSWTGHFAAIMESGADFPRLIVLKTYNPIAFSAMAAFARVPDVTIYPDVAGGPHDPETVRLAHEVAATVSAGHTFDPRTGVIRGAGVPADLYSALPQCSHQQVNAYFAEVAGPGDRVLAMLRVPTPEAARTILGAFGL